MTGIFKKKLWMLLDGLLKKIEFMFMKHDAPNGCLYIKVANINVQLITVLGGCKDNTPIKLQCRYI